MTENTLPLIKAALLKHNNSTNTSSSSWLQSADETTQERYALTHSLANAIANGEIALQQQQQPQLQQQQQQQQQKYEADDCESPSQLQLKIGACPLFRVRHLLQQIQKIATPTTTATTTTPATPTTATATATSASDTVLLSRLWAEVGRCGMTPPNALEVSESEERGEVAHRLHTHIRIHQHIQRSLTHTHSTTTATATAD